MLKNTFFKLFLNFQALQREWHNLLALLSTVICWTIYIQEIKSPLIHFHNNGLHTSRIAHARPYIDNQCEPITSLKPLSDSSDIELLPFVIQLVLAILSLHHTPSLRELCYGMHNKEILPVCMEERPNSTFSWKKGPKFATS